jgi:hypothetical protein
MELYAFADESDLGAIETSLLQQFKDFVRTWGVDDVELINKKAPLMEGQVIPDWNIGLMVETLSLTPLHIANLLSFLCDLSRTMNLPFVVGTADRMTGVRRILVVNRHIPDGAIGSVLTRLRS